MIKKIIKNIKGDHQNNSLKKGEKQKTLVTKPKVISILWPNNRSCPNPPNFIRPNNFYQLGTNP